MQFSNFFLITIFLCVLYAILVDSNFAALIVLAPKLIQIEIQKFIMMIQLHPRNPITNLMMRFKYAKIAKNLHQELVKSEENKHADQ